jgi:hypothetical protein
MATGNTFSVSNFGKNVAFATNTYGVQLTGLISQGGGYLWYVNPANNSGEGINCDKCWLADPGNASATDVVYWAANSVEKGSITNSSIDNAGSYIGAGNLDVTYDNDTLENAAPTTYGSYDYIDEQSSNNGTNFFFTNSQLMNDGTSTAGGAPNEFINCGSNMELENIAVDKNGSATTTARFLNNTNSVSNCHATFKGIQNTLGTAYSALGPSGNSAVTDGTQVISLVGGSYLEGITGSSNNCESITVGNGNAVSTCIPTGASNLSSYTGFGNTAGKATSTVDVGGTLALANNIFTTSTTIPTNSSGNNYVLYIYTGGASGVTLTFPTGTSTQDRVVEAIDATAQSIKLLATSTDTFVTGSTTGQTSSTVAAGGMIRFIDAAGGGTWYNW